MTTTTQDGKTVIAEVCLYGTSRTGAGYLVTTKDGDLFGTPTPDPDMSFTHAVFLAVSKVMALGNQQGYQTSQAWRELGAVRVFHPGGEQYTDVPLSLPVPYYGDLVREPVQASMCHVITVQDLMQHQVARREVALVGWSVPKQGL